MVHPRRELAHLEVIEEGVVINKNLLASGR